MIILNGIPYGEGLDQGFFRDLLRIPKEGCYRIDTISEGKIVFTKMLKDQVLSRHTVTYNGEGWKCTCEAFAKASRGDWQGRPLIRPCKHVVCITCILCLRYLHKVAAWLEEESTGGKNENRKS